MKTSTRSLVFAAALVVGPLVAPHAAEITLPPETARFADSPLPGFGVATAMCSTCHSADYVRMQPPTLSRAAWKTIVTKMQKTFGAPIPDASLDPIVDYIVKTYGPESGPAARPPATDRPNPAPPRS